MNFFQRLFGSRGVPSAAASPGSAADVAKGEPATFQVYDEYGRKLYITRQQWRDNVLIGTLDKARDNPDELYGVIVGALQDGFAADVVPYAEHLRRVDGVPSRGAVVVGIAYMELGRLDDAERVLSDHIARYGEEGVVLANLAKVYSRRHDDARAEATLWHALELDPNQENGLMWYQAIQRERGGAEAALDSLHRIAALPRSWRARLWLARDAIERADLAAAESLYQEALDFAGDPTPSDVLLQMSSDLGNHGRLAEILRLVQPRFDPLLHGLPVGNNLIKANLDLGHIDEARRILGQLHAQSRPDYRETLQFWDSELAKSDVSAKAASLVEAPSVTLMSIEGPIWIREASSFAGLLPRKLGEAPRIAVFGSTVLMAQATHRPRVQLSDGPGRLSRALPLLFVEQIHLATDAVGVAMIPWAQGLGFMLIAGAYDDARLCDAVTRAGVGAQHIVGLTLDATAASWKSTLHILRRSDGQRVAEATLQISPDDAGRAAALLAETLLSLLQTHAGIHPIPKPVWYQLPVDHDASDYLLRLEQQLAVACQKHPALQGAALYGEHEILDGTLALCVSQPANPLPRMILTQTCRILATVRPALLPEYRERILRLQREHPLVGDAAPLIEQAMLELFP